MAGTGALDRAEYMMCEGIPGSGRPTPEGRLWCSNDATVVDAACPPSKERTAMILPKVQDPRFITLRRGGTLTDPDHHLLALWAASCAEHVLHLFESVQLEDPRPREAIEHARAWVRGEVKMMQARAFGGHAMGAARDLRGPARHAAYAAGQAGAVAHVAAHELGAAAYAIRAARAAVPEGEAGTAARLSVPAGRARADQTVCARSNGRWRFSGSSCDARAEPSICAVTSVA